MRVINNTGIKTRFSRLANKVKTSTNGVPVPTNAISEFDLINNTIKNQGGIETKCVVKQYYRIEVTVNHLLDGVQDTTILEYYHDTAEYLRDIIPVARVILEGLNAEGVRSAIAKFHLLTPEEVAYFTKQGKIPTTPVPANEQEWTVNYFEMVPA